MKTIKNNIILKTAAYSAMLIGSFTFSSCSANMDSGDTKEIAENTNDAKFSSASKENDADFLVAAAGINLEEIELGKLAQENSSMPQVKDLGKMMVEGHTKAQTELEALAAKKNIEIPTSITNEGQDAYNKLKDKHGDDFDKEYCSMMVKGHKDAISKFEKAAGDTEDSDIRTWTETMLVSLRAHLEHSQACEDKCSKMKS